MRDGPDVLVVGAGPAGAATALMLARAGHGVVLLDRQEFPRPKPCGDCLSPEAGRVLDRLGLLEAVERHAPARLEGWRVVAPGGGAMVGRFASAADGDPRVSTALAIARERLDATLVDAARRAGVEVRTGVQATDLLRDRAGRVVGAVVRGPDAGAHELRTRLVVGADGLRSVVARRLGRVRRAPRLRKLSLTAHLRAPAGAGLGVMRQGVGACLGIAPLERREHPVHNVTLVVDADRFGRDVARDRTGFFRGMLARFDAPAEWLDAPLELLASGPFDWPVRGVAADGAVLIGDAAGYYDPFTGQGIYQALASAEALAPVADAALRAGDTAARSFAPYARARHGIVAPARRVQRIVEAVLSRPALADAAVARLGAAPAAADALVAVTGDLRPARSLLSPRVLLTLLGTTAAR